MIKYTYKGNSFEKYKENLSSKNPYEKDFLIALYRDMVRIRMIQEEIEKKYCEDEMKTPIHLVIGQEATSVGSCAALRKQDLVFSSHRTNGNYLAKGGDLKAMMSEFYCRANGCVGSRGGSMHLLDQSVGFAGSSAIVGGIVPIATGAGLSAKLLKEDRVTVVYFGDAATEEGSLWESLNFAALKKLPVIFICENNFYSVFSSLSSRQPKAEIYKKAESFGLASSQIDGTNVLDVYEATLKSFKRARKGLGPSFIESVAYRWRGHGGAGDDNHLGYRDAQELKHWQGYCPIATFKKFLESTGFWSEDLEKILRSEIQVEIEEAFQHAVSSPEPEEADLYKFVYSK